MLRRAIGLGARPLLRGSRPATHVRGVEEFTDYESRFRKRENSGRAWLASELRQKSFEDLHKLWYVCLKEKNMLETEKRVYKNLPQDMPNFERCKKVRQTMARIKTVINERSREHKQSLRSGNEGKA